MDALTNAFLKAGRIRDNASKAIGSQGASEIISGPQIGGIQRSDMSKATEQLRHFSGWTYAAIRSIAQKIAGQSVRVGVIKDSPVNNSKLAAWYTYKSLPNSLKGVSSQVQQVTQHKLLDLLANPNDLGTCWTLFYSTVASIQLTGRAFWWLTENEGKQQIFMIPVNWIEGFEGGSKIERWKVRPPSSVEAFSVPAEMMTYFFLPDPSNPHGAISPLQAQAVAVETDEAIQMSQHQAFGQGINPTHVIYAGRGNSTSQIKGSRPVLTPSQREQLIGSLLSIYRGFSNKGEPFIVDGLVEKIERLSSTPEEMDFTESGKTTKERILLGQGVNPVIIGQLEGANRASSYVAQSHFFDFTVNPLIEMMTAAMTEWLGPQFAKKNERLAVWIEPCIPHDAEMNLKRVETAAKNGLATIDELREMMNLPPAPPQLMGNMASREADSLVNNIGQMVNDQFARIAIANL